MRNLNFPSLVGLDRWQSHLFWLSLLLILGVACSPKADQSKPAGFGGWSPNDIATLQSLWLGSLEPLPPDPSNEVGDDPRAIALGQQLFFDKRFSANGQVSCATCHQPERLFTDGLPLAQAIGTTDRHTQSIVGTAYGPWYYWDGRKDSQWSQALSPLESAVEHGGTRNQYALIIHEDPEVRLAYGEIFGLLPDLSDANRFPPVAGPVDGPLARSAWEGMAPADQLVINLIYSNLGKAIAAYERQIMPGYSRFDAYVEALLGQDEAGMNQSLTQDEVAGLKLFLNQGNCTQCHNGPLLTNHGFHSIGIPNPAGKPPDIGRFSGAQQVISDEFNCLGRYSDAQPAECEELRFIKVQSPELMGAFKVPSLRNVSETAPYMHAGQFTSLSEVLDHYNQAPSQLGPTGHTDIVPLGLSQLELDQLAAFLKTLAAPLDVDPELLRNPLNRSN